MKLVLDIGAVRIDATGLPEDAARIETTLREGLEMLAQKLASSPFARDPEAMGVAINSLQIDDLTQDDWIGERGAARVADIMFDRITGRATG